MDPHGINNQNNQPNTFQPAPLPEPGSLEAPDAPAAPIAQPSVATVVPQKKPAAFSIVSKIFKNRLLRTVSAVVTVLTLILLIGGVWWSSKNYDKTSDKSVNEQYATTNVSLDLQEDGTAEINKNKVSVNGSVKILGEYTLVPSERPQNAVAGQQYIDNKDFRLYVFNGQQWVSQLNVADLLTLNATITNNLQATNINVTNLQAQTAQIANQPGFTLPGATTMQGNSFNGAGQLVQLDGSGLVDDSLLSGNVAMLDRSNQVFIGSSQIFRNSGNSATAFAVQRADGSALINVNSQDSRVSINKSSAAYPLEVGGSLGIDNTGDVAGIGLYIGGTQVCNVTGCITGAGAGSINNNTSIQTNANFAISGSVLDTTNPTALIRQYSGQTTALFQLEDSSTNKVVSMDTNGIKLHAKVNSASSGFTKQVPTAAQMPNIYVGTYTGNGTASRVVNNFPTGWGVPKVVMATKADNEVGSRLNIRIDGMEANESKEIGNGGSLLSTNGILSMSSTLSEFTVGLGLNESGKTYNFIALRPETPGSSGFGSDGFMAYGNYLGRDGPADDRNISIGQPVDNKWTPSMVMVVRDNAHTLDGSYGPVWKTSAMPSGDNSQPAAYGILGSNMIQSLGQDTFQVGSHTSVNNSYTGCGLSCNRYYWVAFKELPGYLDIGKYTAAASQPQSITVGSDNGDPSFQPQFVYTKSNWFDVSDNFASSWKTKDMPGTMSRSAQSSSLSAAITSLDSDGFTVGTDAHANGVIPNPQTPKEYYYWALKTYSSVALVDGIGASATYRGKLYTSSIKTDSAGVYMYSGSAGWSRVSSGIPGKMRDDDNGGSANPGAIDEIYDMVVFDDKLYVATNSGSAGNKGAVYSYDGLIWARVTPTEGTLNSTSSIDAVKSLAVAGGVLYAATKETDSAEVYRYNGGTSWTLTNGSSTGGLSLNDPSGDVVDAINLVNYGGRLFAGIETGSGQARVYRWGGSDWHETNITAGQFEATLGIDDITALGVYNGSLYIGTGSSVSADSAEIYRYNGNPGSGAHSTVAYTKVSDATAGKISASGTDAVDKITSIMPYNGRLYASVATGEGGTSNVGGIYEYDGVNSWTLVIGGEGVLGGESAMDTTNKLHVHNSVLYFGSSELNQGFLYNYTKTSDNSQALQFVAGNGGTGFDNIGSISFMAGDQSSSEFNNQGQFLVSHAFSFSSGSYDIAEDYATLDESLSKGQVVAIDPDNGGGYVRRADLQKGDGLRLLGIVSTRPALRLSQKDSDTPVNGGRYLPIALAGRVPVNIDPDSEDIKPGDLIVASNKVGYATKSKDDGYIIAKALESWQKGGDKSSIEVFVTNSFAVSGNMPDYSKEDKAIEDGRVSILDAFAVSLDGGLRFLKNINFVGKVFFENSVEFKDRAFYHDKDFAGYAVIEPGDKTVKVKFVKPYQTKPVISVSPRSDAQYHVLEESENGFTIEVKDPSDKQLQFSWIAIPIREPETYNSKTAATEAAN